MFREMRRKRQLLTNDAHAAVMRRCTHGVLACLGDDDYPYAVPVSFVFLNNKIFFHSAKSGHKIDAISKHPKVSFTVIDEDKIVSREFTTYFRSVIAFGRARIVEDESEKLDAFTALVDKYSGDLPADVQRHEIASCTQALIVAIDIEQMTGKEAIELVKTNY